MSFRATTLTQIPEWHFFFSAKPARETVPVSTRVVAFGFQIPFGGQTFLVTGESF